MGRQTLRIIGGQWRRRSVSFSEEEGLRPTPDRVRETLFNWLGQDLSGQTCLDLFAGSGALGFEAASRGGRVVMVERSPKVCATLKENIQKLEADAVVELNGTDALKFAADASARFDVIFADPPYHRGWLEKLEACLPRLLNTGGMLYLEAERAITGWGGLKTMRNGRAGQVFYHLLRQDV